MGEPNNVEIKALDATANPHLALAALIVAGLLVRDPPFSLMGGEPSRGTHVVNPQLGPQDIPCL
jgi:hypothetical protein